MSNIAYLRVSHTESLNGTSIETQEKRCRAFAELHNFSIDKVYTEVVSGGVEFRKRPIFQKVLSELKGNSKLVVSRLDRLSRKVIDTLKLVDDFKREHKEICITDIGNIHKDGVSKVFVTILASLAEIERENISQADFFRACVSGMSDNDKDLMNFIRRYKDENNIGRKRDIKVTKKEDNESDDLMAKFGIKNDELESIFDLIAEEHPEL